MLSLYVQHAHRRCPRGGRTWTRETHHKQKKHRRHPSSGRSMHVCNLKTHSKTEGIIQPETFPATKRNRVNENSRKKSQRKSSRHAVPVALTFTLSGHPRTTYRARRRDTTVSCRVTRTFCHEPQATSSVTELECHFSLLITLDTISITDFWRSTMCFG